MERNEFIKSLGLGVALICTGSCLSSCGGKSDDPAPGGGAVGNKVNIDLNSQLTSVGSFVSTGGVLFVRLATGNATSSFVATQALCPHQGGTLNWVQASNLIQCSLHSSQYNSSGTVLRQPNDGGTTSALKVYSTSITGTTLTATIS
ncbi:Rieske 2Fe-2S domain-containing protein [Pedobacter sp. LMG 31464]|uniref:Rieske 2Fe-2S domain-containing protein n=1 Tax=Pedobacter planticolens TaxID=2679964 RepID=A0A923E228_9SPHI|nr:Rieske 2Fe-2S domain-containing protein [Pedobacter planticolens]MBB2146628.1 Rieske 2Fe-2S domain-containing protein [Pedobacter planticolens]